MKGDVKAIAEGLTKLRREALAEIHEAGEAGLGFGRSYLPARRFLLDNGLSERLAHKGGPFAPLRERLTPLGLSVRRYLEEHDA